MQSHLEKIHKNKFIYHHNEYLFFRVDKFQTGLHFHSKEGDIIIKLSLIAHKIKLYLNPIDSNLIDFKSIKSKLSSTDYKIKHSPVY